MIQLSSPHTWNPHKVKFPQCNSTLEEEIGGLRYLSGISTHRNDYDDDELTFADFNLESINRGIASLKRMPREEIDDDPLTRDASIDPGKSDIPLMNTFHSSERHSDVAPHSLSERWGISLVTATKTLKQTTQKFLRSAVLPLSRRYRADRVFTRKTLSGAWSTDTMGGRCKSLAGNKYAQVFANKSYFSCIYPMDSK